MREFINLLDQLNENGLPPGVLISDSNGTKYLEILVAKMVAKQPLALNAGVTSKLGFNATEAYATPESTAEWVSALEQAKKSRLGLALPKKIQVTFKGQKGTFQIAPGNLFKSSDYTGRETASGGVSKDYNAGHLNELIMGLACTAKFLNQGKPITNTQLLAMASHSGTEVFLDEKTQKPKGIRFTLERIVRYDDPSTKSDRVNLSALIPMASALSFIRQMNTNTLAADILALFASAIKYANTAPTVRTACDVARQDPNNNLIEIICDGTSSATSTKADLTLKIDGDSPDRAKENLLSLKTTSSDTLGQISGVKFENVALWFKTNYNIDVSAHKKDFDPALDKETLFQNLLKLTDTIYPQVQKQVEDQSPKKEAAIVKHFAAAANFYARGAGLEDVEIVKLDDATKEGNFKILRFSDSLYDAMRYLDLETRFLNKGNNRTIQIWIKPAEGVKVPKGANRLCQFRTTRTGGYPRNYFESGPMLEALTEVTIEPTDAEAAAPKDIGRQKRS
jgi:hypothetical protein